MDIEEKAAIIAILINLVLVVVLGQMGQLESDPKKNKDIIKQIKHLIYIGNEYIFATSLLIALIVFSSIYISKKFKIVNRLF
tara:strand:+ start:331 stop:576 length:246 start_codon:yes stop_codon:yes gene_type:complete